MSERKYKENLRSFEAAFEPQDWTAMQEKLNNASQKGGAFIKRSSLLVLPVVERKHLRYAAVWLMLLCALATGYSQWFGSTSDHIKMTHHDQQKSEQQTTIAKESSTTKTSDTEIIKESEVASTDTPIKHIKQQENTLFAQHKKDETIERGQQLEKEGNNPMLAASSLEEDNMHFAAANFTSLTDLEKNDPFLLQHIQAEQHLPTIVTTNQKEATYKSQIVSRLGTGIAHNANDPKGTQSSPMIMLATDVRVKPNVSVGGYMAWNQSSYSGYYTETDKQILAIGARSTYHIPLSDRVEVYAGAYAGVQLNLNNLGTTAEAAYSFDGNNLTNPDAYLASQQDAQQFEEHQTNLGAIAGMRFKIKEKLGAFVETSPGLALIQAGLHVQLR